MVLEAQALGGLLTGPGFLLVQEAFDMIEREIGRPLEQVFSRISSSPVAAASLGQVYKATLAATGEEVAIKVSTLPHGQRHVANER